MDEQQWISKTFAEKAKLLGTWAQALVDIDQAKREGRMTDQDRLCKKAFEASVYRGIYLEL